MPSYSINAEFENIESPELIAASMFILQNEDWVIKYYNDVSIEAEKATLQNQKAKLILSVRRNEVDILCNSDLAEKANQFIVDSFAEHLHKFISSPTFDHKIRELKHHYFMNNPLENENEAHAIASESFINSLLSFRKNFRVTPAIILLNVLIFAAMIISGISIFSPDPGEVMKWGANSRSMVLQGGWWRLLTCCFLHYGIIHILVNMWALYSIGIVLERMIGSLRFGFAYIIAGLAGSMNSIVWHSNSPSAGASGAIFGMFGLFLALLTTSVLEKGFRTAMLRNVVPMILFNLFIGSSVAMIDNAGHIGGLVAGMICGYLYAWHYKNPRSRVIDILAFVLPLVLIVSSGFIIKEKLPDTFSEYNRIEKNIFRMEEQAIKMEKQSIDSITLEKAGKLWDKSIVETKKLVEMDLDNDMNLRHERLLFYFQKRKQENRYLGNENDSLLLKKTQESIDSIFKILNKKED